ncbi:MAG: hypothetical protein K2K29_01065 [Muribaculaceae bacterium]|nr:hypothetical protein [Muribaculaceae bacterium]
MVRFSVKILKSEAEVLAVAIALSGVRYTLRRTTPAILSRGRERGEHCSG